jgi:hypothetical protein
LFSEPYFLGEDVPKGLSHKQIEKMQEKLGNLLFPLNSQLNAKQTCSALHEYVKNVTAFSRNLVENQGRLMSDFKQCPGQLDHSTSLVFVVTNKREKIKDSMFIVQLCRVLTQAKGRLKFVVESEFKVSL